ncbi:MAG: hypothetical protein U0O21_12345 [Lachnospiraceae bacterium]
MQNKRWNRIRVGIAAVITSVSFASANTVSVECAKQITPETITEEPTTQDFMDLIEYTKDWQTAEEVESASAEEMQSVDMTQADPQTMVKIGAIGAYYGTITDVMDSAVLVQGLEDNAINDRGSDWYSKASIAAVSGYVDGHECTSADDLKIGDRVCVIRSGYVLETYPGSFVGIAKFIVISRDVKENEKAADKDLTRAAVHYAEKIAAKAADNDYLNKMELSDNAMQYAQSAAGLLNIVPEEIMEINLEDAVSSMFIGKININSYRLNIKTNLFGNLVNREMDEEMTAAFNALTEDEYLSTYYPLLSDGAVALWLYYGEKLPSVFTTLVPKSKIEGEKVKTSNTTEIRAILTEPSTYQQVCALMENGGEGDPIKTALARNADIYNDLDSFNPLNSNQGYYVGESKEAADETFYRTVAYDSIQSADCIKLISGLSNNVEQKLYGVQETLIAALTGVAPGTLEAYYVSKENNNQYVLTDIRNAAFNAMQDTTNQTAAWNFSQIIHSQMSVYSAREGWDRDVLLVYSFSDLTVLVTIEQGDNNFMKVTPLLVLTEENNENLGSQDQMDSFIQSLLEQYKFEKFDIAN